MKWGFFCAGGSTTAITEYFAWSKVSEPKDLFEVVRDEGLVRGVGVSVYEPEVVPVVSVLVEFYCDLSIVREGDPISLS